MKPTSRCVRFVAAILLLSLIGQAMTISPGSAAVRRPRGCDVTNTLTIFETTGATTRNYVPPP